MLDLLAVGDAVRRTTGEQVGMGDSLARDERGRRRPIRALRAASAAALRGAADAIEPSPRAVPAANAR